ncbi:IQ domain-containing protein K-like [Bacillus rossius redtenbacheri]|uniref:IQ domain-containing protein K-like n=1 Tax=Bacillus rossius redtenbacheri TaxID=93214 RepID=UPI002FDCAA0F
MWWSQFARRDTRGQLERAEEGSSLWEEICAEGEALRRRVWPETREYPELPDNEGDSAVAYLEREVFPWLLPALEACLFGARDWGCVADPRRCVFDGLDRVAEHLWNRNPRFPERRLAGWTDVYDIPFAREWLADHPRPFFPRSWLWSPEEASVVLQAAFRAYLVRRDPEVQEMRQFWRAVRQEQAAEAAAEGASDETPGGVDEAAAEDRPERPAEAAAEDKP